MNRFFFIVSLLAIFSIGVFLIQKGVSYLFIVLVLGTIVTSLRRYYLGLKPWWGAPFRDIGKYFKEK